MSGEDEARVAAEVVEEMARAICGAGADKTPWEQARASVRDLHREEARAALAALVRCEAVAAGVWPVVFRRQLAVYLGTPGPS